MHCLEGRSRASSLAIAFLIDSEGLGLDEALRMLRAARPTVSPNEGFLIQLKYYDSTSRAARRQIETDSGKIETESDEIQSKTGIAAFSILCIPIWQTKKRKGSGGQNA